MKILLIGFSSQSAGVLSWLINRTYGKHDVITIERTFGSDLKLCLPTIEPINQDAQLLIISLDGVGILNYSAEIPKRLQNFIGVRSALLITKANLEAWRHSKILPKDFIEWLSSPYTKADITTALDSLMQAAPHAHLRSDEFGYNHEPAESFIRSNVIEIDNKSANRNPSLLHQVLDKHFAIKQSPLLHELLDVTLGEGACHLMAGSQLIYIDRAQNLALVSNFERLMDYCQVANNFQVLTNVLISNPIKAEAFERVASQIPKNGYKKYALNTLLWQMYSMILPHEIDVADHRLLLKMRYMPNFTNMPDTPEYVRALIASCLNTPKSIKDLSENASGVQVADKKILNRVFLLAMLSGTADTEVLKLSFERAGALEAVAAAQQKRNEGVQKAQKTGFLKRLLGKLGL